MRVRVGIRFDAESSAAELRRLFVWLAGWPAVENKGLAVYEQQVGRQS